MYYIKKSEWKAIPNGYKGRSITDPKIRTVFAAFIYKGGGTTLLFEHTHFEIIDD